MEIVKAKESRNEANGITTGTGICLRLPSNHVT